MTGLQNKGYWLELEPAPRVLAFFAVSGLLGLALPAIYLLAGWNDQPGATAVLLSLAAAWEILNLQGISQRLRFGDREVSGRVLGFWFRRRLPPGVVFSEYDDPNPHRRRIQRWLDLPSDIVAMEPGTGRRISRIRPELLGSYRGTDYRDLLDRLNRRYSASFTNPTR